ncbi:hypothetical protein [Reichenbachiella agariperforans]|uniref:Uncharacterized protein n=1 Tax=Reichenbachiella agariperforans TaxID=156994 RepID=A0A1M6U9K6_REIAG|nr:hypothetical protein [Reichenbachiella agariperforans]MBU2912537.1 hypothetical protein [Reichenbachiella agariperforans]SHK65867.1 hypothetical protein SAMN04488028_10724 [Reichenbachiella agariperforans]
MIISKPKVTTLFSISIFLVLAFGALIYGLLNITESDSKTGWYILIYTSGPIGVVVLLKVLTGLKYMRIGKEKFDLKMPFRFSRLRFDAKDIEKWSHSSIKTYGGQYEEVTWRLKSGKEFGLSKQENTDFDKVLRYMKKKLKKLEA